MLYVVDKNNNKAFYDVKHGLWDSHQQQRFKRYLCAIYYDPKNQYFNSYCGFDKVMWLQNDFWTSAKGTFKHYKQVNTYVKNIKADLLKLEDLYVKNVKIMDIVCTFFEKECDKKIGTFSDIDDCFEKLKSNQIKIKKLKNKILEICFRLF